MMSFFKKEPWVKPFSEKVSRRVSKIPTGELEIWAEQALIEISKCLSGYSKNREQFYLDEALQGAEALHAVVNELHTRMTPR
jgi:hypothetical protein